MKPDPDELDAAHSRVRGTLPATLPAMNWSAYTTHRDPVLALYAEYAVANPDDPDDHVHGHATVDPRDGKLLRDDLLKIGSDFFYPMHIGLHNHVEGSRLLDRRPGRAGDAGGAGLGRRHPPAHLSRVLHLPAAQASQAQHARPAQPHRRVALRSTSSSR